MSFSMQMILTYKKIVSAACTSTILSVTCTFKVCDTKKTSPLNCSNVHIQEIQDGLNSLDQINVHRNI